VVIRDTILLVTAHPDDEVMFFSPLLDAARANGWRAEVLCLTDGAAVERRAELDAAARVFYFIPRVCEIAGVRDGMREEWDLEAAAAVVSAAAALPHIAAVVTFDERGVTGHLNHSSARRAVARACRASAVPVFELVSLPFYHRFTGPCGFWLWVSGQTERGESSLPRATSPPRSPPAWPQRAMFIRSPHAFPCLRAHAGMRAHASQYVWWRGLWVIFSAYSYANVLLRASFDRVS
jgi:N-acetylglucosaminylphosphatidylinositol deacetylase